MFFTDIWPPGLFMSLKCIIIIIIITILDYGSGPTIVGAISAAAKASTIVLSDLLPTVSVFREWLENKPRAFSFQLRIEGDHFYSRGGLKIATTSLARTNSALRVSLLAVYCP